MQQLLSVVPCISKGAATARDHDGSTLINEIGVLPCVINDCPLMVETFLPT